jgi:hypothetical protein
VREPYQDFRQHRFPPPLLAGIAGLQHRVIGRGKRFHQVEHPVPQACFHAAGTLVIGRVLRGELTDDRFESRVDAHQRLGLSGRYRTPSARKR